MELDTTMGSARGRHRLAFVVRVLGGLFMANGIWGLVSGLMNLSVGLIKLTLPGFSIDLLALVFIYAGFKLVRLEEGGRKMALFLAWASLLFWGAAAVVGATLNSSGVTIRLANSELQFGSPLVLWVLVGAIVCFQLGLVLFFSAKETKECFRQAGEPALT